MSEPNGSCRTRAVDASGTWPIATLVGRYIERRETRQAPCAHDLFAVAAEFGEVAVDALRTLLACYEAMRASEHDGAG